MKYKKFMGFPLVVIVVASLWFISKYKDIYKEEVNFKVSFINVPEDVIIDPEISQIITPVEISASGFTLIWEKIFGHGIQLDFSQNTYFRNDSLFFNPIRSLKNMKRSKTQSYEIISVDDIEIPIIIKRFISKKVPLQNDIKINYSSNFVLIKEPYFKSDSIIVTGNDNFIRDLKAIKVTGQDVTVVDTLTKIEVDLNDTYPQLKFKNPTIILSVIAAQMTEGEIEIPVKLVNAPLNIDVKLIPDTIEIIYSSSVVQFDKIKPNDFIVIVDYNKIQDLNTAIVPEINVLNKEVVSYRIAPKQVQVLTIK